jgi:Putative adhesin
MPTFDTPEPILAVIDMGSGGVWINASDRTDTVVQARPSDPANDADVQIAQETVIEYADGRLLVKAPKKWIRSLFEPGGSIDVTVELPTGSSVDAKAVRSIRSTGRLGDCTFHTASGDIDLDQTGSLRLRTANGDVSVGHAAGHADVQASGGTIRVQEIDGSAVIKTANGGIAIGRTSGDLRLATASGTISVGCASASVEAKSATGNVVIGEVVRGAIALSTGTGRLEIGVREGTAARLDLHSGHGAVRSELTAVDRPEPSDETVEVRALTGYGEILIHRSRPALTAESVK